MLALTLGPLSLPVAPLLGLGAAWLAGAVAAAMARSGRARGVPPAAEISADVTAERARGLLWQATLAGLLAARLAHLALNARAYAEAPLALIDLRDGGWQAGAALAVGLAWLAWQGWRHAPLRPALAAGAAAGLALWGAGQALQAASAPAALPEVELVALDGGERRSLRALADGRPVVVNLWASWCGPCRQEMPVLAAAPARHPQVLFVLANQGEPAATVRQYLAAQGLPARDVWLDAGSRLGPALGSRGLPTTVFFDARGRAVAGHLGVLNAPALQARVEALQRAPR